MSDTDALRNAVIEECALAAHCEWFAGNRHRYASEPGPAIEAAIRALATKNEPAPVLTTKNEPHDGAFVFW